MLFMSWIHVSQTKFRITPDPFMQHNLKACSLSPHWNLPILTGSRHRRSAGHTDVRGVLCLLQDDVPETRPLPADDGVQRQEGSPDGRGAGQLPAQRAEGQRSFWRWTIFLMPSLRSEMAVASSRFSQEESSPLSLPGIALFQQLLFSAVYLIFFASYSLSWIHILSNVMLCIWSPSKDLKQALLFFVLADKLQHIKCKIMFV